MTKDISSCGLNPQINQNTSPEFSAGGLEIVHATNGRIRIRATEASLNEKLEKISADLRQYKGVREVCANQQTGSLVVTFDDRLVSLSQMLSILQEFEIKPISVSNVDAFAAWRSLDFWQEQSVSLIPLVTGLAVTGGLGISGLAAIPVYMITADATRRVIDYVEPKFSGSDVEKTTASSVVTSDERTIVETVYTVVHAIPGRIRFHLPRLAEDKAYGRRLEKLLQADPQVVNLRVNYHAASIAIAYQPAKLAVTHWVNLIELAEEIHPSGNSVKVSSDSSEIIQPNVSSLWAEMKHLGMSFSLDYIAKLSL
ncbi:hypothetical protein PN465_12930 [Nodularia spumigena CS-584]|jgi:hypothetical protein|uniref:HMA domain-containing protein n=1 Tax=Nodularia spumigena UHCC 0039 TaxID=1914872 RepID=A0A2S0Q5V2_NODSP|nr:hypothetical protein [Nodularia spumigena]AHJ31650.1 Cd/Co/Hg/Pb/Zn-translocating P-type ATPase [Nodularia spumigena CCY9414]AVZ31706.1 hypothetical protein BMF81_04676 [Nodularia spumigena UHCC 0039]EAW47227.1 hypothetical protein N9414_05220 [Nodularia spumigena CCY9414]MDB9383114.1 hypothetical protein [Nodularia spumigena CS-584]MEA5558105.1 hypothetical protein [Nodularia spumigena CH309]